AKALLPQQPQKLSVELATDPLPLRFVGDVDRYVDAPLVGCAFAVLARVRVPDDLAVSLGHEPRIDRRRVFDTGRHFGRGRRLHLEGRDANLDVRRVDLSQGGSVIRNRETQTKSVTRVPTRGLLR